MSFDENELKAFLTWVINSKCFFDVVELDRKIVGSMAGSIEKAYFSKDCIAYEFFLYAIPQLSRIKKTKVAVMLVNSFTEWAKYDPRVKQIRPNVCTGDMGAVHIYDHLGYAKMGETFLKAA
jgi:hypothetical protein